MASVRMTIALREQIQQAGRALFTMTISKSEVLPDDFPLKLWAEIDEKLFKPVKVNEWPSSWTRKSTRFSVGRLLGGTPSDCVDTALDYAYVSPQLPTFTTPLIKPIIDWIDDIKLNSFRPTDELFQILHTQRAKTAKATRERNTFCDELKTTLGRCNTLKQFLDAWPHGESLIAAEVMASHNAVTEKTVRNTVIAPDVSATMSSVLLKRTISG